METVTGRQVRIALSRAAREYEVECGWDVIPGAYPSDGGGSCSCCRPDCLAPCAHPVDLDWLDRTPRRPTGGRWLARPYNLVLPVGPAFEVFDVPARLGEWAAQLLAEAGTPAGPIEATPAGRWLFFTAPCGRVYGELAQPFDVWHRGAGEYVLAPPSRTGAGPVNWVRPPGPGVGPVPAWLVAQALEDAGVDLRAAAKDPGLPAAAAGWA